MVRIRLNLKLLEENIEHISEIHFGRQYMLYGVLSNFKMKSDVGFQTESSNGNRWPTFLSAPPYNGDVAKAHHFT